MSTVIRTALGVFGIRFSPRFVGFGGTCGETPAMRAALKRENESVTSIGFSQRVSAEAAVGILSDAAASGTLVGRKVLLSIRLEPCS